MRRTVEDVITALRSQIVSWANGESRLDVRVLVYPPEWEPILLQRVSTLAEELGAEGTPIEVEDVAQGFLATLDRHEGLEERLLQLDEDALLHDLGEIANGYLRSVLSSAPRDSAVCRVLVNTGALGAFVSYSAITSSVTVGSSGRPLTACVIAFPGTADERSLSLLGLRTDTNYRVARI